MNEIAEQYKLVFSGELAAGKTVEQVIPLLRQAFKLSDSSIEKLFQNSGNSIVLKKAASLEEADAFCEKFFVNFLGLFKILYRLKVLP